MPISYLRMIEFFSDWAATMSSRRRNSGSAITSDRSARK